MIRPLSLAFALCIGLAVPACTNRPVVPIEAGGHRVGLQKIHVAPIDKVDLLLVVDNSSSMADKQSELAQRIPALVAAITAPHVGSDGRTRQVKDVHVGVITSSLGSHGTASCPESRAHEEDGAMLLPRAADPTPTSGWSIAAGATDPTPTSCPALTPTTALTWTAGGATPATTLESAASCVVASAKDDGCGYEETLESMYHFLIDPAPYATALADCAIDGAKDDCRGAIQMTMGNDALLRQRAAFLRPDSLVAIVLLSDENDASLMPVADDWKPWSMSHRMAPGWSGCANVPDSFQPTTPQEIAQLFGTYRCRSCEDDAGDPACGLGFPSGDYDHVNLRAFDQVQRFGRDFLWPTQRYVDGLTQPKVVGSDGKLAANPLFAGDARDASTVLMAGIVGVPKPLVANPDGTPKPLSEADWDLLISDDHAKRDPHMIESILPRKGIPKFAGDISVDAMNGGDRDILDGSDLQYACIAPRATDAPVADECDGASPELTDPICGPNHKVPRFKAYPALRHLRVLHDLGASGLVASICDSSYAGAIRGVVDRIGQALDHECLLTKLEVDATSGGVDCLLFEAFTEDNVDGKTRCEDLGQGYCTPGQYPCRLNDSDHPPMGVTQAASELELPITSVDAQGNATEANASAYVKDGNVYADGTDGRTHLVCELMQLSGGRVPREQTDGCEHDPAYSIAPGAGGGFCYSNDTSVVGAACAKQGAPGKIRFMGDVEPASGAELFTYCVK